MTVTEQCIHGNLAAQIASGIEPEVALIGLRCMIRAHRVTEALQLSEILSEKGTLFAAEMFTWTITMYRGYYSLRSDMVNVAYQFNRESVMEGMIRLAQSQPEGFPITEFLDIMNEIISKVPREEKRFDMRLYKDESDFHACNLLNFLMG